MSSVKKAANHAIRRDYPPEAGVELRGKEGEQSTAPASTEGEDGNKVNTGKLIEKVLDRENLNLAYKRVKKNGGSHGVDGMKVDELLPYLKQHGESLKQSLLEGKYRPQPVRRVEIPKTDGGIRLLGIPTAVDRMIQQSIAQVLSPIFEMEFSKHSYGFRPGRNAHQAIKQAQQYINEGYKVVVDLDLEKFFDRVNHDKLMYLLAKRIRDKRVLKLIRAYLESGVMLGGLVSPSREGTPQGGPLSPLLSNVMLHELDKELERRGHRFCRYADDCNIYVKSKKAGNRVMDSVSQFIEKRLKLKVNREKSAVDYPTRRKFLGFSFYYHNGMARIKVHAKPLKRLKARLKKLTGRSIGISMEARIDKLNQTIRGWVNYYILADMTKHCQKTDEWLRRRLRMCYWKQWKKIGTRHDNLTRCGISSSKAWEFANTRKGYWHIANSPILASSLTNIHLRKLGLSGLSEVYSKSLSLRTAVCRTARPVV
ncbi:MAG: group II intron reverse transcriptase/maturase [Candidatus Atribacteria bacterium]|nr:group II intron reverse transcriptase/maturase [Candidatus Atribacteria bacterium]